MKKSGDAESFNKNWETRDETNYLHWTKGAVDNQIQLAFRRHWITFNNIIKDSNLDGNKSLEVGCGRGSLSAYFSEQRWDTTLLDISPIAIERAKEAFNKSNLKGKFDVGDCLNLPYEDKSFDLVFSIGLLEHFEEFDQVISEQVRILKNNGLFIGYVVPELIDSLQKNYNWINDILKAVTPKDIVSQNADKEEIYRSDELSPKYLNVMKNNKLTNCWSSGIYSLPMISHSIDFPFTLLNKQAEKILVNHFTNLLNEKEKQNKSDPWLCSEGHGQAFIVVGTKKC